MNRTTGALGALFVLGSIGTAQATTHMAGSRMNLDVPSQFTIIGAGIGSDVLHVESQSKGDVTIHRFDVGCADIWQNTANSLNQTLDGWAPSWLPYGWEGRTWGGTSYGLCKWVSGGFAAGVVFGSDDVATWDSSNDIIPLLSAIDAAWISSYSAENDTPVTLPGSGLTLRLPHDWFIEKSVPSDSKDVLLVDTGSGTTRVDVFRASGTCRSAAYNKSPGTIASSRDPGAKGFTEYAVQNDTRVVYCSEDTGTTIVVVSPAQDDFSAIGYIGLGTLDLLLALHEELEAAPSLGAAQTLPHSGLKASVPSGWTLGDSVSGSSSEDHFSNPNDDGYSYLDIGRATDCSEWSVGTHGYLERKKYDPLWLPYGWSATDVAGSLIDFCATIDGGAVHVQTASVPTATMRKVLVAVLYDLAAQNAPAPTYTDTSSTGTTTDTPPPSDTPYVPSTSSSRDFKPILPFPIEVSLQTIKAGERGWGVRGALDLDKRLSERASVGLRGEVGYDSKTKISYDVGLQLDLRFSAGLKAFGQVGRDQIGEVVDASWYYGIGGAWGYWEKDAGLDLSLAYDWRTVPEAADMAVFPDHEWRFGGQIFWPGKRIAGFSTEYRTAGQAKTFLIGLKLRL